MGQQEGKEKGRISLLTTQNVARLFRGNGGGGTELRKYL